MLYSITSSARASRAGDTSRPSALGVFRLMISSSRVGCWVTRLFSFQYAIHVNRRLPNQNLYVGAIRHYGRPPRRIRATRTALATLFARPLLGPFRRRRVPLLLSPFRDVFNFHCRRWRLLRRRLRRCLPLGNMGMPPRRVPWVLSVDVGAFQRGASFGVSRNLSPLPLL